MNKIIQSNEGLREEHEEAKAAKRQKRTQAFDVCKNADSLKLSCQKCGGKKIISIDSKACDNNYCVLPWGREVEGNDKLGRSTLLPEFCF